MRTAAERKAASDQEMRQYGGGAGVAMKKRLALGVPTEEDTAYLEQVRVIRDLRAKKHRWDVVARHLGKTERELYRFQASGKFRAAVEHLERADAVPSIAATAKEVKAEQRGAIQALLPAAVKRLKLALASGVEIDRDGNEVLVESKAADHAMDTVLEATGLLEPEGGAVRPVIHIDTLVIQDTSRSWQRDDQLTQRIIDVTPTAAP